MIADNDEEACKGSIKNFMKEHSVHPKYFLPEHPSASEETKHEFVHQATITRYDYDYAGLQKCE